MVQDNQALMTSRRSFMKLASLTAASVAASALLTGCDIFDIDNPYQEEPVAHETPGLVDFVGLKIQFDTDSSHWMWDQIQDANSAFNGYLVAGIPATATNEDTAGRVLGDAYCAVTAPDGTQLTNLQGRYPSDDLLRSGNIPVGSTKSGYMHVIFAGPGTYSFTFNNLLGRKVRYEQVIARPAELTTFHPFASQLNASAINSAVPVGQSFIVGDFELTFQPNGAASSQVYAVDVNEPGSWMDGRMCLSVPLQISNRGSVIASLNPEDICLYDQSNTPGGNPYTYFDSSSALTCPVSPGQSIQRALHWIMNDWGVYHAVFDVEGVPVVAEVPVYPA